MTGDQRKAMAHLHKVLSDGWASDVYSPSEICALAVSTVEPGFATHYSDIASVISLLAACVKRSRPHPIDRKIADLAHEALELSGWVVHK